MSFSGAIAEAELAREEVAELCSRLVQLDSAHPEGRTDECVAFIKEYMDGHGIRNEIHSRDPLKPNMMAEIPGGSGREILWVGHLDVVPEGTPESWTHPPYSGKITDDGFIYVRGSSDMKGACAAAMVAARILSGLEEPPPNKVKFWFTADEEIGGGDGARWLAETGCLRGDVCVIGDGYAGGLDNPSIDLGCKGGAPTRLVARGRTAHGSTPYLGENAIMKLMEAIPWVERIGDFRLELPREPEEPIRSSVEFILKTQALDGDQTEAVRRIFHHPTVSCNIISGGVKRNVVPDHAEAVFDIRLTPGSRPLKVKARIEELVREAGIPGVEVSVSAGETAGYYESPDTPFASQLAETVQKVTGRRHAFKILTGGTDAVSIKRYTSIPCLGYGTSMVGQAHQPDERNAIENLVLGAKVYSAVPLLYRG
ncbi:MAG: M20/M25/M40 family metallo-hydrolase [Candidatus Bathyarchaeota archaeon]|nr:M20/M25/M40 family metallo-hydrolase [Candidatus Bathyarchaeota archaeon]